MKNKLRRHYSNIGKSKEAKTLLSNFGYLSALEIAGYIFPIFTLPYLARVIGVESFGKLAFASAVIVWFSTVADWGFNFTATRDVAKNRNNKEIVSEIFSNVLWSRIFLMLISLLFLLALLYTVPTFEQNKKVILVTFLVIPGQIMFPTWFFQALERMKYITFLSVLSRLLFTIAVFIFIKEKSDYILQPLLISMGSIVSGVFSMYIILFKWGVKLYRPSIDKILKTTKDSTDVFINNLTPNLYNSFSTIILGFFGGSVSNGLLDAGRKFVSLSHRFMNIISRVFFPFLSRKIDKHNLYVKINMYLSVIITILLFILAPIIIKIFYTSEFNDAVIVLRIMSFSLLFLSLDSIYGTNYMIIQGYEKELRNITLICSIVGFVISFPLIYYFDYIGAALTITFTRGLLGIATTIKAKSIKRKHFNIEK